MKKAVRGSIPLKNPSYRFLDIDDFYILSLLRAGYYSCEVGKIMGLSSPAISHRVRRYPDIWPGFLVKVEHVYSNVRKRHIRQLEKSAIAEDVMAEADRILAVLLEERVSWPSKDVNFRI